MSTYEKVNYYSNELILDFKYGTEEQCKEEHKKKFGMESIELATEILKLKIKKEFSDLIDIKTLRKDVSREEYSNILLEFKWSGEFVRPKTILVMYSERCKYFGSNSYEVFFETYGFFHRHKPEHMSAEIFSRAKFDVIRHLDMDMLFRDIKLESNIRLASLSS